MRLPLSVEQLNVRLAWNAAVIDDEINACKKKQATIDNAVIRDCEMDNNMIQLLLSREFY